MTSRQAGLMIAAPHSGSGKTVITLALLRVLADRGLDIRAAKAGPDYIDPAFHEIACGHASVNLDPWAMAPARMHALAEGQGGTHLLVEAMMGLFDGAADGTAAGSGSAADLAQELGLPVVLVVDAGKQSHSVAALARGFRDHRPNVAIAGVILNRVGSARHEAMLRDALGAVGMHVFGAVPRSNALELPARHLGLVQASEQVGMAQFVEQAARAVGKSVAPDAITQAFAPVSPTNGKAGRLPPIGQRIAIASDAAFSFTYPHLLADWRAAGADLSFFSPLQDEAPHEHTDAVFLPGGYPELHGGRLSASARFLDGLRAAADRGALLYGECGGYMVLGEGIEDADGARHAMAGLLKLETSFLQRRLQLGYRRLEAQRDFVLGNSLTGHEFHYSTALEEAGDPLFGVCNAAGAELGMTGLRAGKVMGSYIHVIDRQAGQ
ncbi:MAG: cobyrinate a,c-diamide synthase [Pseudomonadota bacterium]|nr:cobyrinate a,c-diamide synthase [Pseudomonadota bacterium]